MKTDRGQRSQLNRIIAIVIGVQSIVVVLIVGTFAIQDSKINKTLTRMQSIIEFAANHIVEHAERITRLEEQARRVNENLQPLREEKAEAISSQAD